MEDGVIEDGVECRPVQLLDARVSKTPALSSE